MRELRFVAITLAATSIIWASFILVIGDVTPDSDQYEYSVVGRRLARGFGLTYTSGALYVHSHPPLYPAFLGLVYAAGGGNQAVRFVQLALALATLVLVYFTARRGFGKSVAAAALLAGAAYLPTAFYVTELLSEILFTFLLVAGFYLVYTGRERAAPGLFLPAGVLLGLAGLTRGIALAVAVALTLHVLLRGGGSWGRRAARAGLFSAGVVAAVAPWSAYVYRITGHAVLSDTKSAQVLYLGNNPGTPDHHAWDATEGSYRFEVPPGTAQTRDHFERSRLYFNAAVRYMEDHPARTCARFVSKFADMWEVERLFLGEYRAGYFREAREPWIKVYIAAEVAASAAALLLFWGAAALMPKSLWRGLTLVVVASTALIYALTIAHARYNYPLIVLGAPALGYFFVEALPRLKRGGCTKRRLALAAAAAAALLLVWGRMVWLFVARGS